MEITYHLSDHTLDTPEGTISCAEACTQLGIRMPTAAVWVGPPIYYGDGLTDKEEMVIRLDEGFYWDKDEGNYETIWNAAHDLCLQYAKHIGADQAIVTD